LSAHVFLAQLRIVVGRDEPTPSSKCAAVTELSDCRDTPGCRWARLPAQCFYGNDYYRQPWMIATLTVMFLSALAVGVYCVCCRRGKAVIDADGLTLPDGLGPPAIGIAEVHVQLAAVNSSLHTHSIALLLREASSRRSGRPEPPGPT
jgi:hypothetical protein